MKVAVAVSGGVDSLLSLYLLTRQGHQVLAVHGLFLPGDHMAPDVKLQDFCRFLGVDLVVKDLREAFEEQIVRPFVDAYLQGLTPNPCAQCNKLIKFGLLWDSIQELGVDKLATGHYACLCDSQGQGPALYKGQDQLKEQSYFLSLLNPGQLKRALFPLCAWHKAAAKAKVADLGLERLILPESQEVCFIPGDNYRAFLATQGRALPGPGPMVDSAGNVLGEHKGLHHYTLGQRRGLGISHSEPLYVLHKDIRENMLVVGPRSELGHCSCQVSGFNFLVPFTAWPEQVLVKLNYRQQPNFAQAVRQGQGIEFRFADKSQLATPGQVASAYDAQGQILGGGVIVSGSST